MWWTWAGFSWISNQASADQPFLRTVMTLAMIAVFVAALTIPEAYDDLEGGWNGPLVFAGAYAAVRIIHVTPVHGRRCRRQGAATSARCCSWSR